MVLPAPEYWKVREVWSAELASVMFRPDASSVYE
jgi:hypothetical protein